MSASIQFRKTTSDLGGASTATQIPASLNNLFDDLSPAETSAGDTEYRAFDVYNSGDAAAAGVKLYCTSVLNASINMHFAIEASPLGSTTAIANESTAPTVQGSFAAYPSSGSALALPNIPNGSYCRVWVKRIAAAATPNLANDGCTVNVELA